jgi:hypothetical protein
MHILAADLILRMNCYSKFYPEKNYRLSAREYALNKINSNSIPLLLSSISDHLIGGPFK